LQNLTTKKSKEKFQKVKKNLPYVSKMSGQVGYEKQKHQKRMA
jgi:hypothetical protein